MGRRAGNTVIVLVASYLGLILINVGAYFLASDNRDTTGLYQRDALRGHAMVPGFEGTIRTTADFYVRINSNGYRDTEWEFDSRLRFLVVGDSFVFGEPMPIEEGFVVKAQRLMEGEARFYNAGVSGYGVAHVLKTIEKECPVVRPQHIIYMYYLNDTSWDNMAVDALTVVDRQLVSAFAEDRKTRLGEKQLQVQVASAKQKKGLSLSKTVRLVFLGEMLKRRGIHPSQLLGRLRDSRTTSSAQLLTDDPALYPPVLTGNAARLIEEMKKSAGFCMAKFTMVVLPADHEVAQSVVEPATTRLLSVLENKGIDILDLHPGAAAHMPLKLTFDRHYNPAATAWVAESLVMHLRTFYPRKSRL